MAPAESRSRGGLRASDADREQVIDTLKAAFVQGRLTEDELGARVDRAYASPTYAELAEVTADIPAELARARPPRNPWRATKIAWRVAVPGRSGRAHRRPPGRPGRPAANAAAP